MKKDLADSLQRFVEAQDPVYDRVVDELRAGRKRSHWMWFVFPQLKGLGMTATSTYYGISSIEEAERYLQHDVLARRLVACSALVLRSGAATASQIFGYPDDLKLRSCMTLFDLAQQDQPVFGEVLVKYFAGQPDDKTLQLLD